MNLERRAQIDRVLRWFRSCSICGAMWPPIDFLCGRCWRLAHEVQNQGAQVRQSGYVFPVYTLWTWTPETEAVVRPILHGFKRGWAVYAAQVFAEGLLAERHPAHPVCFVHPPASDLGYDHARLLVDCLLECLAGSEALVLERRAGDRSRQKRKNAAERSLFRFERVEKFSDEGRRFVFVDDVITTGSTAQAAYMALGDPEGFEVWALAARPKLAVKSGF